MFTARQTKAHSQVVLATPRKLNWRKPKTCLTQPNTGSGMDLFCVVNCAGWRR